MNKSANQTLPLPPNILPLCGFIESFSDAFSDCFNKKNAAGKPEGSVHFLFTTKWPESNKQRKTARDREAFPKHSDRKLAVDSIISLSRCPIISMIITNCLALKTHFGGELRL